MATHAAWFMFKIELQLDAKLFISSGAQAYNVSIKIRLNWVVFLQQPQVELQSR